MKLLKGKIQKKKNGEEEGDVLGKRKRKEGDN